MNAYVPAGISAGSFPRPRKTNIGEPGRTITVTIIEESNNQEPRTQCHGQFKHRTCISAQERGERQVLRISSSKAPFLDYHRRWMQGWRDAAYVTKSLSLTGFGNRNQAETKSYGRLD